MLITTSLEFSRKLFEIIGEQKTEKQWSVGGKLGREQRSELVNTNESRLCSADCAFHFFSAYTFGELLRVIPLIYEKAHIKKYYLSEVIGWCAERYVNASTPEQGMRDVEAYLETMI